MRCSYAFRALGVVGVASYHHRETSARRGACYRASEAHLRKVASNPRNPNFDQYIFESFSGSRSYPIRWRYCAGLDRRFRVCPVPSMYRNPAKGNSRTLSFRLVATVGVLTVAEYIPYIFQILT